jgi:hypothetical protein
MVTTMGWRKEEESLAMAEYQASGAGQEALMMMVAVFPCPVWYFCCVHPLKTVPSPMWAYRGVHGRRQVRTSHVDTHPHRKDGKPNNQPKKTKYHPLHMTAGEMHPESCDSRWSTRNQASHFN